MDWHVNLIANILQLQNNALQTLQAIPFHGRGEALLHSTRV